MASILHFAGPRYGFIFNPSLTPALDQIFTGTMSTVNLELTPVYPATAITKVMYKVGAGALTDVSGTLSASGDPWTAQIKLGGGIPGETKNVLNMGTIYVTDNGGKGDTPFTFAYYRNNS